MRIFLWGTKLSMTKTDPKCFFCFQHNPKSLQHISGRQTNQETHLCSSSTRIAFYHGDRHTQPGGKWKPPLTRQWEDSSVPTCLKDQHQRVVLQMVGLQRKSSLWSLLPGECYSGRGGGFALLEELQSSGSQTVWPLSSKITKENLQHLQFSAELL